MSAFGTIPDDVEAVLENCNRAILAVQHIIEGLDGGTIADDTDEELEELAKTLRGIYGCARNIEFVVKKGTQMEAAE